MLRHCQQQWMVLAPQLLRQELTNSANLSRVSELKKLADASQQLSNLDAAGLASQRQCSALFTSVADAKLRLAGLQKQVRSQH
jgi:hypothetical protein